ncbi:MAG: thioredoxin family protein [Epsilonproteobacteria bacterium]|nr:thioredoxin family protein [Campylobacterota bacterium]
MQRVRKLEEIQHELKDNDAVLLYVTTPNCKVCEALRPKIIQLFNSNFPKVKLLLANLATIPALAGEFNIMSAPTMILFFEGKEFLREGRNVSLALLEQKVKKVYNLYFE